MKNIITTICIAVLMGLTVHPAFASMSRSPKQVDTTNLQPSKDRVAMLEGRLKFIKSLDKKTISKAERKSYRIESIEAKKEIKQLGGGVYISVGALILIIVLLIILL